MSNKPAKTNRGIRDIPNHQRIASHQDRLIRTEELLCAGQTMPVIIKNLSEEFNLSPRRCKDYVFAVRKRWADESDDETRDEKKQKYKAQLEEIYRRALSREKFSAANRALETLARLDGISIRGSSAEHVDPSNKPTSITQILVQNYGLDPKTFGGTNTKEIPESIPPRIINSKVIDEAQERETSDDK